jgi:predicted glycosyltransferase
MPRDKSKKSEINILYAVLNWGLGHATRSIPLIRALNNYEDANLKFNLTIVSTGRALNLLRSEFPELTIIDLPDYNIKYSQKGRNLIFYVALQLPRIIYNMFLENRETNKLVVNKNIDIIISDNRYGVFSLKKNVNNYFITHQLRFKLPKHLSFLEIFGELFNRFIFRFYDKVFVMDNKDKPNISGELSHRNNLLHLDKIKFIGLFSDTIKKSHAQINSSFVESKNNTLLNMQLLKFLFPKYSAGMETSNKNNTLSYLVIISGVEPQRSIFEEKVLSQINKLDGKKIIILGLTEIENPLSKKSNYYNEHEVLIFNNLPRETISDLINLTDFIVCRSGYSTIMDLVYLKKKALLIPTPGQTEQEYLADYYKRENLFYSVSQDSLDLERDIEIANKLANRNCIDEFHDNLEINNINLFLDEIIRRNQH